MKTSGRKKQAAPTSTWRTENEFKLF